MNLFESFEAFKPLPTVDHEAAFFKALMDELSEALSLYWSTAYRILQEGGVKLLDAPADYYSLERNFFSAIFLYSYHQAGIPESRRIFYAAINQCLRGMVTGCDNILDDEYKQTLHTDLPAKGRKFRSVLDIMASDRILFEILLTKYRENDLSYENLISASRTSLSSLTRSGAQEASEEGGIDKMLKPEEVLKLIHHYKTGLLFQCPWALPVLIEKNLAGGTATHLMKALYQIGMGCQVMDDMVDLSLDLKEGRHNYVASLIYHDSTSLPIIKNRRLRLESLPASGFDPEKTKNLLFEFPDAQRTAAKTALDLLEKGMKTLFAEQHALMVEPAILFIARRIGADRFMTGSTDDS